MLSRKIFECRLSCLNLLLIWLSHHGVLNFAVASMRIFRQLGKVSRSTSINNIDLPHLNKMNDLYHLFVNRILAKIFRTNSSIVY